MGVDRADINRRPPWPRDRWRVERRSSLTKQVQLRMGQANVRRWTDDLLPLVLDDDDPLGVQDLATHRLPLEQAPLGYEIFQTKRDGAIKVVLSP